MIRAPFPNALVFLAVVGLLLLGMGCVVTLLLKLFRMVHV